MAVKPRIGDIVLVQPFHVSKLRVASPAPGVLLGLDESSNARIFVFPDPDRDIGNHFVLFKVPLRNPANTDGVWWKPRGGAK